jgi:thiol-disulfide isomerase/thioredoxin
MKNIFICFLLATFSCVAQDVVKFSGKIKNPNSDKITLKGESFKQVIPVAKDGTFSASFAAPEGMYDLFDGAEYSELYLKNGFDLTMTLDTAQFDETISYKGKGAVENNLLAANTLEEEKLEEKLTAVKDKPMEVQKIFMEYDAAFKKKMTAEGIDPGLKKAYDQKQIAAAKAQEAQMKAMMEAKAAVAAKFTGKPSPDFNYENHKGGKTKLSDFKGKYVYIDNWATWCGPCRAEIPHLQKMEEKFHGKNIEFVSISIDEMKNHDKWKKFVDDKKLGGVQLMADKDWRSDFVMAYGINSIPRFILIGPDGNVIDADAKRPSDPTLTAQLDELLK